MAAGAGGVIIQAMNYLSLKIDGQWAVLDEGTEIALEGNNPLFSDAGSKSYLFRLHVESNRHIFGTSDEIYGESYYKVIDGKRSTLYVMGIPVMTGKIALEDEVMMEDGYVVVNLVSGNLEFAQMIEGMNCREVEQAEDVEVGISLDTINEYRYDLNTSELVGSSSVELPKELILFEEGYVANVAHPYPEKKYCNIRACYSLPKEENVSSVISEDAEKKFDVESSDPYFVLGAGRRASGVNFYVMYFLDCLFKQLGVSVSMNNLSSMEDMTRLAMVNLNCDIIKRPFKNITSTTAAVNYKVLSIGLAKGNQVDDIYYNTYTDVTISKAVATSNNFPDTEVVNVVNSLANAFGVKMLYNSQDGSMQIVYIKDVLKDNATIDIQAEIYEATKIENNLMGFRLTYNGADDDTSYNYSDYDNVVLSNSYRRILGFVTPKNKTCYIDSRNGNAYRIKVDEDATTESELNASLFEVGAFADAVYGDCSNDEYVEVMEIPFQPIINNDVNKNTNKARRIVVREGSAGSTSTETDAEISNKYAFFIPEEFNVPKRVKVLDTWDLALPDRKVIPGYGIDYSYISYQGEEIDDLLKSNKSASNRRGEIVDYSLPDSNKVNSYDTGFMLGIMRGPGNAAGVEYFDKDFDNEGNYRVAFTSGNYAFTSDSIDNCNRDFDYNGTGEGGVDYSGRFSLKLRAGKYDKDGNPVVTIQDGNRANRGLYDKFWKEYAYFAVHKKILRIVCRMEVADLVAIDWTKRYRIGGHVGFIANYSYSVSTDGMSDVELDLYYI